MKTINEFIHSMYKNTIYDYYTPIITDFILTKENEVIAKGKAEIQKYSDEIDLSVEDFNANSFKMISDNIEGNTVIINHEQIPRIFSCDLVNFPLDNRVDSLRDKEITIKLPKVKVNSNFNVTMSINHMDINCSISALYNYETGEFAEIICL